MIRYVEKKCEHCDQLTLMQEGRAVSIGGWLWLKGSDPCTDQPLYCPHCTRGTVMVPEVVLDPAEFGGFDQDDDLLF